MLSTYIEWGGRILPWKKVVKSKFDNVASLREPTLKFKPHSCVVYVN